MNAVEEMPFHWLSPSSGLHGRQASSAERRRPARAARRPCAAGNARQSAAKTWDVCRDSLAPAEELAPVDRSRGTLKGLHWTRDHLGASREGPRRSASRARHPLVGHRPRDDRDGRHREGDSACPRRGMCLPCGQGLHSGDENSSAAPASLRRVTPERFMSRLGRRRSPRCLPRSAPPREVPLPPVRDAREGAQA